MDNNPDNQQQFLTSDQAQPQNQIQQQQLIAQVQMVPPGAQAQGGLPANGGYAQPQVNMEQQPQSQPVGVQQEQYQLGGVSPHDLAMQQQYQMAQQQQHLQYMQMQQMQQMPQQYGAPGGQPGFPMMPVPVPVVQFQPQESQLEQLNSLIEQSFSPDNNIQQQVYMKLQELEMLNVDQLCVNLSILVGLEKCNTSIRQVAGLTLKAMTDKYFARLQMATIDFIKMQMKNVFAMEQTDSKIIKTISQVMSLIMLRGGYNIWPELLPFLTENIATQLAIQQATSGANETANKDGPRYNQDIVENSIHTIAILIEDCSKLFEDVKFEELIVGMFPQICKLISPSFSEAIVSNAINTINLLLLTNTEPIMQHIAEYLQVLLDIGQKIQSDLAAQQIQQTAQNQPNYRRVKWRIVQGITTIMDLRVNLIIEHFDTICEFMLGALMHKDQQVALAASDFFSGIQSKLDEDNTTVDDNKNEDLRIQKIEKHMERILSALLECCIMSNADRMNDMSTKQNDVLPVESSSKFNEDENEDDDENSEENSFTTLRKSSAFALQQFSKNYSELVFVKMQGYLQTMLQSSNEDHQEAAVLALGAISDQDGSYCAIEVHLEQLVPFLINKLDGSREDVRATTCWTLSKFSEWIGNNDSEQNQQIFLLYHSKLIQKMADPDENVQEAACNAYSQLVEVVPEKCQPHLLELLNVLNSAVDNYQDGPLIAMFDCVGSIAQAVGDGLNDPQIIATLLPLLSKKWEQFDDSNRSLLTLFECFESVISAIKEAIEPYAKNIFDRCIKILKNVLSTIKSDDFENIYEETDFYIRSMDLIAQIIQALNEKAEPIVMQSDLILILREYLDLRDLLMKQYVFSMVGDLQKHLGACIKDKLPEFIHCACLSLYYNEQIIDPTQNQHQLTVCNNACWCLGEMAVSEVNRDVIKPFTDEIVRKLLGIYQSARINKSLAQNISITLGRLGLINPEAVALHLDKIAKQWCVSLRYVKGDNDDEKYQAYKGLCYTIARNTKAIKKDFPYFCSAIVHYHDPRPELHQIFKGILHVFKQNGGEENWNNHISKFPDDLQQKLKHKFDL